MRWDNLTAISHGGYGTPAPQAARAASPLPLALPAAVVRRFSTPGFAGMTFYEIRAKSIINRVAGASRVPFEWTVNPYRGCSHACVYCFARKTHTYLDLGYGADFDTKVVVKVNAGELLRKELAAPKWGRWPIAMGTNVDCYQRGEGKYQLMREIIATLRDFANPFSVLTKGTLIVRDLDLLRQAAEVTQVAVSFSVGFLDQALWRSVEPGTPSPRRRLDAVRAMADAGFSVGVLLAPVLPGLTDTEESIDATVAAIAAAGATSVTALPLHLRDGARQWYASWLNRNHPELLPYYRDLYSGGSYLPDAYQREVTARVRMAARRYGLHRPDPGPARLSPPQAQRAAPGTPDGARRPTPASGHGCPPGDLGQPGPASDSGGARHGDMPEQLTLL